MEFPLSSSFLIFFLSILALFFIEKKSFKKVLIILLFALLAAVINYVFFAILATFIKSDYGVVSAFFSSVFTILIWSILAKEHLGIRFKVMILIAFLPLSMILMFFQAWMFYDKLQMPKRDAEYKMFQISSSLKELFEAATKYKSDCGHHPVSLKLMIEPDKLCKKWTGYNAYNYQDAEQRIIDPWGRPYRYKILNSSSLEISSFGADGVPGGKGLNKDFVITTPK